MIRYKLTNDCRHVWADKEGKSKIPIFARNGDVIFVDLLEKMAAEGICETIKCRLYWSDGNIQEAFVIGFHITIHNKDEMFDGRFNGVPTNKEKELKDLLYKERVLIHNLILDAYRQSPNLGYDKIVQQILTLSGES